MACWFRGALLVLCVTALTWRDTKAEVPTNVESFQNHVCTLFHAYDVDCDGQLELTDFVGMYLRIPPALLVPFRPLNIAYRQFVLATQLWELFPLTDRNLESYFKYGPVSLDELLRSMTARRYEAKYKGQIDDLVEFLHKTFSYEREDMALTYTDYRIIFSVFGISDIYVNKTMKDMDENNDGLVQVEECRKFAYGYYITADPNDRSNSWAGPVISCADVRKATTCTRGVDITGNLQSLFTCLSNNLGLGLLNTLGQILGR